MKTRPATRRITSGGVRPAEKVVGVLGGMGPEATALFFGELVARTAARCDAEHLRVIIDNNPKVPDRTAAILGGGESPLPELTKSARALRRAGADFIVIPCVTVHAFHDALQKRIDLPVLHIVEETRRAVMARRPRPRRVGLLATTGAIRSGLFQRAFEGTRTRLLVPGEATQQDAVMRAVYAIKSGDAGDEPRALVRRAAEELVERRAEIVIAGCTEIPLVLRDGDLSVPVVDPLTVLVEAAIRFAGATPRSLERPR
jgi:aspartate racemase